MWIAGMAARQYFEFQRTWPAVVLSLSSRSSTYFYSPVRIRLESSASFS